MSVNQTTIVIAENTTHADNSIGEEFTTTASLGTQNGVGHVTNSIGQLNSTVLTKNTSIPDNSDEDVQRINKTSNVSQQWSQVFADGNDFQIILSTVIPSVLVLISLCICIVIMRYKNMLTSDGYTGEPTAAAHPFASIIPTTTTDSDQGNHNYAEVSDDHLYDEISNVHPDTYSRRGTVRLAATSSENNASFYNSDSYSCRSENENAGNDDTGTYVLDPQTVYITRL